MKYEYIEVGAGWNKDGSNGPWVSYSLDADKVAEAARKTGEKKLSLSIWTVKDKKGEKFPDLKLMVKVGEAKQQEDPF